MHPLLRQDALVADARDHDYWLVAYSPLARGRLLDHPTITTIADDEGVTPAQVSLAWLLTLDNVAAVPKATGEDHIVENLDAADRTLSAGAIDTIESIDERRRVVDYDGAPWEE